MTEVLDTGIISGFASVIDFADFDFIVDVYSIKA